MPTIGEQLLKQLADLPEDQAIEISASSEKERNSIRVSIYKAKALLNMNNVTVSVKRSVLKVYRGEKKENLKIKVVSASEENFPLPAKEVDVFEQIEKAEAVEKLKLETLRINNDESLSKEEREDQLYDLRAEVTAIYDKYNTINRKKLLQDRLKYGKVSKKKLDEENEVEDDDDGECSKLNNLNESNNYPDPQEELRKEMTLLSQSNVKN